MKRLMLLLAVAAAGCNPTKPSDGNPPPPPPSSGGASVSFDGAAVAVEVRTKDPDRLEPMRGRSGLKDGQGILSGWPRDRHLYFWPDLETPATFDVAFLDAGGTVTGTGVLSDKDEAGAMASKESRWALFVPSGWLAKHGVKEGSAATFSKEIAAATPEPMPEIKVGGHPVRVELSWTYSQRSRGLMHRRALSAGDGMLFIYPHAADRSFWMKNTHITLDIAHFDAEGKLLNVVTMPPYKNPAEDTLERARSIGPAQFVLEVRPGWFKEHGLTDDTGRPSAAVVLEMPDSVRRLVERAE